MQQRKIAKWLTATALLCTAAFSLHASAYKLPEQSVRSLGLSAAYVAGAESADANYYNPANMGWLDERQQIEGALTLIHLPEIAFSGMAVAPLAGLVAADSESKSEDFLVPTLHYVGPKFGNWRFGFSVVAPGGLTKRWNDQPQRSYAEEFTLAIVEFNPAFSYTFNEQWSIGGGVRVIYTDGTVRAYSEDPLIGQVLYAQNMEGDSFDFGYNLALSFRPQKETTLSVTYRSNVDLTVEGDAKGGGVAIGKSWFDTGADVEVPLPATLALAVSHDFGRVKVEAVYERTFWSKYEKLDFNFDDPVVEQSILGEPKDKDWDDTNTFRIGLTWHVDERWDMLFGYAWDETPIPEKTVGFELPDSDAQIFSVGSVIRIDERWEAGFALLYDKKDKRRVSTPPNENGIAGTFDKGGAYLATVSVGYRF
ncbi:OmpP1/FadL family transporter [Hydrogenimonas urashimensis]|uniref:OmpP1/FadL family transporter n=1 Tax=Hydrogenimonas urashimensis TaxID=2740515 RepID=UPI0019153BFE|nr:OmpP1/FadL family transporter [Hydrogenimonas urashimensis]